MTCAVSKEIGGKEAVKQSKLDCNCCFRHIDPVRTSIFSNMGIPTSEPKKVD